MVARGSKFRNEKSKSAFSRGFPFTSKAENRFDIGSENWENAASSERNITAARSSVFADATSRIVMKPFSLIALFCFFLYRPNPFFPRGTRNNLDRRALPFNRKFCKDIRNRAQRV